MALYEFECAKCSHRFEQITSSRDPDRGVCPKCGAKDSRKLISRFAVGGQGDLRETTQHGCHDCNVSLPGQSPAPSSHDDHGHDHGHSRSHGDHDAH